MGPDLSILILIPISESLVQELSSSLNELRLPHDLVKAHILCLSP